MDDSLPPSSDVRDRESHVAIRDAAPTLMLVGLTALEELRLGVAAGVPGMRVLRVRYALPACVRMDVVRPELVVLGARVPSRDVTIAMETAYRCVAAFLQVSPLLDPPSFQSWIERMVVAVGDRRRPMRAPMRSGISLVRDGGESRGTWAEEAPTKKIA